MNIIVTSIGRRVQLIQHLRNTFQVIGVDASPDNAARNFTDAFFLVPRCDSPEYIDKLFEIAQKNQVKLIIPLYEKEFLSLLEAQEKFQAAGIKILLSTKEIIDICNDKRKTQDFFEAEHIAAPQLTQKAPAVVKPVNGMGSQGVYVVDTQEELAAAQVLSGDNYIIQEKINGVEYTVDVLCDFSGNVIAVVPRVRMEVRSGEVAKSRTERNQTIIRETLHLIAALNRYGVVIGPITVQCFYREDGSVVFLEINPRFGGGVPLTFEAGVDYGKYLEKCLNGYVHKGEPLEFEEVGMYRYDMAVYWRIQ